MRASLRHAHDSTLPPTGSRHDTDGEGVRMPWNAYPCPCPLPLPVLDPDGLASSSAPNHLHGLRPVLIPSHVSQAASFHGRLLRLGFLPAAVCRQPEPRYGPPEESHVGQYDAHGSKRLVRRGCLVVYKEQTALESNETCDQGRQLHVVQDGCLDWIEWLHLELYDREQENDSQSGIGLHSHTLRLKEDGDSSDADLSKHHHRLPEPRTLSVSSI